MRDCNTNQSLETLAGSNAIVLQGFTRYVYSCQNKHYKNYSLLCQYNITDVGFKNYAGTFETIRQINFDLCDVLYSILKCLK